MLTEEQIKTFCVQKAEENALKKANTKLADIIKEDLIKSNKTDASAGKYSVSLTKRITEDVDELKMLEVLKQFWMNMHKGEKCPFIGTVEYVDMNKLEAFMYREELPEDVILALDACRIKKESIALSYKIEKGEN